ncbi:MAG TPA: ABC transporter ATP-binding protein [Xanthobacteraceae bacterium]|jgi:NitT/TauT family transport system ATP-binding protein
MNGASVAAMPTAETVIEVRNVTKVFGEGTSTSATLALDNVSLRIGRRDLVGLVGPSGCGKSTLLNLIAGLDPIDSGEIVVEERIVTGPQTLGYVFQQDTLLPWRSVLHNAEFALEIRGMERGVRRAKAAAWLDKLGLAKFSGHHPHQLSGGMRKRLQLATVLAGEPRVLLMDEPFGALDAQTRTLIEDDFLRLCNETMMTVIFVTHDLPEAIAMCSRVAIMTARPGRIKSDYPIGLPHGLSTTERRLHPDFQSYYSRIWNDLRDEVGSTLTEASVHE